MQYSKAICSFALSIVYFLSAVAAHADAKYDFVAKLLQSDAGSGDAFGDRFAVDGSTLVVSGDESFGDGAYVFERDEDGGWTEVAKLLPIDGATGTDFGRFVEVDGDTIAVGAYNLGDGALHVYERDSKNPHQWNPVQLMRDPAGPGLLGNFSSAALDGDTLAVGAFTDRERSFRSGAVYMYQRTTGAAPWVVTQKLFPSDPSLDKFFGLPLKLDGDRLFVGADSDDEIGRHAGAMYYFSRGRDGVWRERQKLLPLDGHRDMHFGHSLGVAGNTVVVGAYQADAPQNGSGAAYVFEWDGSMWWEVQKLTGAGIVGDQFGTGSDIEGSTIAVGARGQDPVGAVYVFERGNDGVWNETDMLVPVDPEPSFFFGDFIKMSDSELFVGDWADREVDLNSGAVHVYRTARVPILSVTGACPGALQLSLRFATPSSPVSVVGGFSPGTTIVPGGVCSGAQLDLAGAQLLQSFRVDASGEAELTRQISNVLCGRYLQVIDRASCAVSSVIRLPE